MCYPRQWYVSLREMPDAIPIPPAPIVQRPKEHLSNMGSAALRGIVYILTFKNGLHIKAKAIEAMKK